MIGHMLGAGDPHSIHTTGHQLYQNKLYCVYFENDMQAGKGTSWERAVGSQDSEKEDRLYHLLSYCVQHLSCFFIVFLFFGNLSLEEELDLTRGGTSRGRGRPALDQQSLHLERRRVEKRTLEYDVEPRAGSCRGAPVRARLDLPLRGWKGSPPPVWRGSNTQKA